jgi:hypothetical protein
MSGKFGYQVVETGKLAGNNWSATKDTTCAEWASSPEGKEVVVRDNLTGETQVMPREEAQQIANAYNKLRGLSR